VTLDRLIRLSMTRAALRHYGIGSGDAWVAASPEQRARLEPEQRALVERAVTEAQADVLAALFSPVDWQVSARPSGPGRYVTVSYRADDPEGERRAWAAIRAATR